MSLQLRQNGPLVVTFIFGFIIALEYFVTGVPIIVTSKKIITTWTTVIVNFAPILATLTHFIYNIKRLTKARTLNKTTLSSLVLVVGAILTAIIGLIIGVHSSAYAWIENYIIMTLGYTLGCTLVLWVALAYYKSWKTGTLELVFVSGLCFFALSSTHPLIMYYFPQITFITEFLIKELYPGAMRGFYIAAGIGGLILALRVITGQERRWLGG